MNEIELIANLARDNGVSLSSVAVDSGMSRNAITYAKRTGGGMTARNTSAALGVLGYGLYAAPLDAGLDDNDNVIRIDGAE